MVRLTHTWFWRIVTFNLKQLQLSLSKYLWTVDYGAKLHLVSQLSIQILLSSYCECLQPVFGSNSMHKAKNRYTDEI
ncbi:hypothetical protein GQ457_03G007070 [Hibiscus cannabinus]